MLGVSADDKHCLCASGAEVAEPAHEPAQRATVAWSLHPAPRLAGLVRPTLGPSALAGQRLAAATAPACRLRKASEL